MIKVFYVLMICTISFISYGSEMTGALDNPKYGLFLAGRLAQQNHDFKKTAYYYTKALKNDPQNTQLLTNAYIFEMVMGNFEKVDLIIKEISLQKKHVFFSEYVSVIKEVKHNNFENALSLLPKQERTMIDKLLVPLIKAWIYVGKNDVQQAIEILNPLQEDESTKSFYYYHLALMHYINGNFEEMDKAINNLSNFVLPSSNILPIIKKVYQEKGKWNSSHRFFKEYETQIENNPTLKLVLEEGNFTDKNIFISSMLADIFYSISRILWENKLSEPALILNALSMELMPQSELYKVWGGELFEGLHFYDYANKLYERIKNPDITILFKKALNFLLLNENIKAELILKDIYAKDKKNILVILMLAELYRDTERLEIALHFYEYLQTLIFHQSLKDQASFYFSRAMLYEKLNKVTKMEADLKKAIEITPNNPMFLNYLGYIWLENEQKQDEALEMILKAHNLSPEDPYILDSLAWAYYKKKDYNTALNYAEKATNILPGNSLVNAHLGDIYEALGRKREALFQYKKSLDLNKDLTPKLKTYLKTKI